MIKVFKRYFKFVRFLKRAYSDYRCFSSAKAARKVGEPLSDPINNATFTNIINYFEKEEVGIIYQSDYILRLVVKNYNAPTIYAHLASILPEANFILDNTSIHASDLLDAPLKLTSEKLKITYKKENLFYEIFLETYFRQSQTGKWQCSTKTNPFARVLSDSFWSNKQSLKQQIVATSRTLANRVGVVDVVYTWANIYDQVWLEERHKRSKEFSEDNLDSISEARINDNSELKYSIRSIKLNLPWINNIYIVSTGKAPDWLKLENSSSIYWVTHDEIIDSEYLPTFNSHVIESNLHKIKGLSRKFIYMNDDIMIVNPTERDYFFDLNGQPIAKLENYGMVNGEPTLEDPDYLNASRNSANILHREFGYYPTRLHEHCPQVFDRKVLSEIVELYPDVFHSFMGNRFRQINDVNLTSFLYHHYAYITRRGLLQSITLNKLIKNTTSNWRQELKNFPSIQNKFKTLCLNEGGEKDKDWVVAIPEFLENLFPQKGNWEK